MGEGFEEEGCIFIFGMPRSGSTLIEQILASHPRVVGLGEVGILDRIIRPSYEEGFFKGRRKVLRMLGGEYVKNIRNQIGTLDADFITDKNLLNFVHIGMIKLILPRAKVINCCRHPMDNCLSIYKNLFRSETRFASDMMELGRYYCLYYQLVQHWREILPGFIYDQQYEKLVEEPEKQIRLLLDFCGLEWSDKCLDFHKEKRSVKTLSISQVRKPVYKDSVQLWKKYGDKLEPLHRILEGSCL
jgi:hypothetical protein